MSYAGPSLPATADLEVCLTSVLTTNGFTDGAVRVLMRDPNPYVSSYPSEIVTCGFPDGRRSRIFCKYESTRDEGTDGYRRGLAYEAAVYGRVLGPARAATPLFYGAHWEPATGQTWVFLEYLEGSQRVHKSGSPAVSMVRAAGCIGAFHAKCELLLQSASLPFLFALDREYYLRQARQAMKLTRHLHRRLPWLRRLVRHFQDSISELGKAVTVIHGEYYPKNALLSAGQIRVVDWQSAAVGAGEIDIAALTTGHWGRALVEQCELAYRKARWQDEQPHGFERRLALAHIYWPIVFLGDSQGSKKEVEQGGWLEELRSIGERFGLV